MSKTDGDEERNGGGRTIVRRAGLPGTRAVVGGLLVAVAIVLAWLVSTGGGEAPTDSHVVAARRLPAGHRIEPTDVRVVEADLPDELSSLTYRAVDDLIGSVTEGPLDEGELVQAGSVGGDAAAREAQLSFSVDTAWAIGGSLRVGDRIDVHATGDAARTRLVLSNVTVLALTDPDDGAIGSAGTQTITIGGPDAGDLGDAIALLRDATLTVVRVTEARPVEEPPTGPTGGSTPDATDPTDGDGDGDGDGDR